MIAETERSVRSPVKLWNKNFLLWWLGSAQSAFGSALAGIALSFLVLRQTGSAGAMGTNLALSLFPLLLSPVFGAWVDRLQLKVPLVAGNCVRGALQFMVGILALRGAVDIGVLHGVALTSGLIAAFYSPAAMGITPRLIPRDQIERASGLMQGTNQTMNMLGLILGGALIGFFGNAEALIFDGVTFLFFALLISTIDFPSKAIKKGGSLLGSLKEGLSYTRTRPVLIALPLLAFFLNASFAPLEMLVPKRMVELGGGEQAFGLFFGLILAGLAAGSFSVSALGARVDARPLSVIGMVMMGVCFSLLASAQQTLPMYIIAPFLGIANAFTNVGIGIIFQKYVQPEYYARVGSLLNMLGSAGMPLTLLGLAQFVDRVAIFWIYLVAGVLTLVASVVWWLVIKTAGRTLDGT